MKETHSNSLTPRTLVMSLGGSLVVPKGGIDTEFLKEFKALIEKHLSKGWRFVLVVGGGKTAREYIDAAKDVGEITKDDQDWLGIHSSRLNGHLIRTVFRNIAHPVMFTDPNAVPKDGWEGDIVVAAGWRPGWSTDYVATRVANQIEADVVVNLSNTDTLYDKDPNKFDDATPIYDINWPDFRKIVGEDWDPGMSAPFDPVASKLAHESGLRVALMNGKNFENLDKLLSGEEFLGTVIK